MEGKRQFVITQGTTIHVASNSIFKNEANLLGELFITSFGKPLSQTNSIASNQISLRYDKSIAAIEGYHLSITPGQVILSANSPAGMFMAVQTIRQLLPVSIETKGKQASLILPALEIEDQPSFSWRGIHLDVSRHFFSINYLRKLIDLMALYKLNKFHLHLTDDQGWRIEIKKYPNLLKKEDGERLTTRILFAWNGQKKILILRSIQSTLFKRMVRLCMVVITRNSK